jgi:hypothetical protein
VLDYEVDAMALLNHGNERLAGNNDKSVEMALTSVLSGGKSVQLNCTPLSLGSF